MTTTNEQKTLRKFRRERALGRYLLNPAVHGLSRLGVRTTLAAELETVGRKTGQTRRVPVSAQFDNDGAKVVKALETTPVSVRIDFTDQESQN